MKQPHEMSQCTVPVGPAEPVDVSVIIPAFNAASTVVRALDSVRAQRGLAVEVIVVNDGSRDNTEAVVTAAIQPGERMVLLNTARNSGVSAARNLGLRHARGKYVAFLDADDIWLPGKLRLQVDAIMADPAITLVSCNSQMTAPDGRALKEGHVNRPPVQGRDAWKTLLVYNFIPTPTVLSYTKLVQELGGFDENLAVGEDLDLWIKLGTRGKIVALPQILINYYDIANSLMKRHGEQTAIIVLPMIEKHLREQSAQLNSAELRAIRGQRAYQIACDLFFSGSYHASVPLFLKAAGYGTRPLKSCSYVPRAIWRASTRAIGRALGLGNTSAKDAL